MKYDEEYIIKDLIALVQNKLPAKITAINTEKNDTLVLSAIGNDKYVFETLDSRILNFKGFFVMYGLVGNNVAQKSNGNVLETVTVTLQIGTFDNGEKERSNTLYKLLRYRRALKEIVLENPDVFRGYAKSEVVSLSPNAFPYDNNSIILTIGVDVIASITCL